MTPSAIPVGSTAGYLPDRTIGWGDRALQPAKGCFLTELEFREVTAYKSVTGVGGGSLPFFTVLAGVNGAGKTHLLKAIKEGAIEVSVNGQAADLEDVVFHDWNSLAMKAPSQATRATVRQEAEQIATQILQQLKSGKASQTLKTERERHQLGLKEYELLRTPLDELDLSKTDTLAVQQLRSVVNSELKDSFAGNETRRRTVEGIEARTERLLVELGRQEIVDYASILSFVDDPLRQQLSRVFLAYQWAWEANDYARYRAEDERGDAPTYLTDEEFQQQYGPPPWDLVNDLLVDQDVDLEVVPPPPQADPYDVELRQRHEGTAVGFEELSSGEQMLIALILSLYGVSGEPPTVKLPRLMLLDEIDAPLHPAMVRTMLRLLTELLIDNDVGVILTTHSPTTVALAPEGSVVKMSKTEPRLESVSNTRALTHLTAGITALSVRFADRCVAFTEAVADANAYTAIFDSLRALTEYERGVAFLPASLSKTTGGAAAVRQQVERLRDGGLDGVFGVIDRDDANKSSADGAVLVVGEPGRYTLENYLFDPLLLVALLIREGRLDDVPGLADAVPQQRGTYRGLETASGAELQDVADAMVAPLSIEEGERTQCRLASGEVLELPNLLLQIPGHELWELWTAAVPPLLAFNDEEGLRRAILERVVPEVPRLLSEDHLLLMAELAATA